MTAPASPEQHAPPDLQALPHGWHAEDSGRNGKGFSADGPWHIFLWRDGAFVGIVEARTRAECWERARAFTDGDAALRLAVDAAVAEEAGR
jgi:hypothetical protein